MSTRTIIVLLTEMAKSEKVVNLEQEGSQKEKERSLGWKDRDRMKDRNE